MAFNKPGVGGKVPIFLNKKLGEAISCVLWILYTGFWDDSKQWVDTCYWND